MSLRRWFLVAVFLLVALGCARLGVWQLQRLQARRAWNARRMAARTLPVLDFARAREAAPGSLAERRVRARGRYDDARTFLLRNWSWQGTPGVEVITPLRVPGAREALLVDRGWLPAPDGASADPDSFAEPGVVEVVGVAKIPGAGAAIPGGGHPSVSARGRLSWRWIDLAALRASAPYPLAGFYLRQLPDPSLTRYPHRLDPAPLDEGPHLSYAIQWFFFASLSLLGVVLLLVDAVRRGAGGGHRAPDPTIPLE